MLVGNKTFELDENLKVNTIIVRDLPNHLEEFPELLTFSAWYAIIKNNLFSECENIAVFEYDCTPIHSVFKLNELWNHMKTYDILGISEDNVNFYIDVKKELLNRYLRMFQLNYPEKSFWLSSTNFVMKRSILESFVNMYWKVALKLIIEDIAHCKYYHERIFSMYAKQYKRFLLRNTFIHLQKRSHNEKSFMHYKNTACHDFNNVNFCTYGDDNFKHERNRIAKDITCVASAGIFIYSNNDIDKSFINRSQIDWNNSRGGGFWLWKPFIVQQTLSKIKDGDILIYADSGGCFFDTQRLSNLIENFKLSKSDFLCFQTKWKENLFTIKEVFKHFNTTVKDQNSGQIAATWFILKKSSHSISIVNEWLNTAVNYPHLFSLKDQPPVLHRHDQSVLSCILKKSNNVMILPYKDDDSKSQYGFYKTHRSRNQDSCTISYALKYEDLYKEYGLDANKLKDHWLHHGMKEKRIFCNCF